ncbi:MAG: YkgJ family cysteine cluster protein [Bacteroidetes bacterium]|nr:YkgJ family cysteine cluster protein [Bacteroidota bacterium]MBS1541334.1 YkgJ family cysteine cluster protein [Bacteroidota bacterium]
MTDELVNKINAVQSIFDQLDRAIASFQNETSLHCQWGCGKCCFKPDIEATVLEFLPFAHHLYQQGLAEAWLTKTSESDSAVCLILNPTQSGAGLCSQYAHRGLICRLFGYAARTNKYGEKELVTCSIIKTEQVDQIEKANEKIKLGLPVPVMHEYYMQLASIDFDLSRDFFPINAAIRKAIEKVLSYYAYR